MGDGPGATAVGCRHAVSFRLLDARLQIVTDDADAAGWLRFAYRRLLAPPLVPARWSAEILLHGKEAGVRFAGTPVAVPKVADAAGHLRVAAAALFRRAFMTLADHTAWYAAGVELHRRALLLTAPSGTGKTTIALALLRLGYRLYGDEYVLLRRRDRHVVAFERALVVRDPDGAARDADADELFGRDVFAAPAPLVAAVLLRRGAEDALRPLSPVVLALDAAPRVDDRRHGLARVESVAALLAGVRCYVLTVAAPAAAARCLESALASC